MLVDPHVAHEHAKIPATLLPLSLQAVASQGNKPVRHLLTIMLKQYMEAWDLKIDKGLAVHFDTLFSSNIGAMATKAAYPDTLKAAIAKEEKAPSNPYVPKHKVLADAIGYAPGTIYNVFTSMDALYLQVNGRTLDMLYGILNSPATCAADALSISSTVVPY